MKAFTVAATLLLPAVLLGSACAQEVPCDGTSPTGCATCNPDVATCTACAPGYVATPVNNACVACADRNCLACSSSAAGACTTCKAFYTLNPENGACDSSSCYVDGCVDCDETSEVCLRCDTSIDLVPAPVGNACQCAAGLGFIQDEIDVYGCKPCSIANCANCGGDYTFCEVCVAGYTLNDDLSLCVADGGACVPTDVNCATCSTPATPAVCTACKAGYTLQTGGTCEADGACVPADGNCATCSTPVVCTACKAGYTLQTGGTCVATPPPPPAGCDVENCLECAVDPATQEVTQVCKVCADFLPTTDGQCVPLPGPLPKGRCQRRFPGCTRCDKAACRCLHCRKGLRLVKGRCVRPHRPHHKRCKKGSRLVKGRCVRTPRQPVCKKGMRLVKGRCVRVHKRHPKRG